MNEPDRTSRQQQHFTRKGGIQEILKKTIQVYKNPQNRETEQHLHGRGEATQYFNPLRREKKTRQFINTAVTR